jgi:hypothetical protein
MCMTESSSIGMWPCQAEQSKLPLFDPSLSVYSVDILGLGIRFVGSLCFLTFLFIIQLVPWFRQTSIFRSVPRFASGPDNFRVLVEIVSHTKSRRAKVQRTSTSE